MSNNTEKFEQLAKVIEEHKDQKGGLMPVLQEAQAIFGCVPLDVQEIIAEGQAIAQKLYDDILKQAESTCDELEAQAEKQQMEAIKFITERIVGSSVDC